MGRWEADWDCGALQRIVVLLFALANLADLAAGASFLRRRRLLGILNHGEAEARAFVIGFATGAMVPTDVLETTDDPARLAIRLRALALMLCALLAQAPLSAQPGPRVGRPARRIYRPVFRSPAATPPPDTS